MFKYIYILSFFLVTGCSGKWTAQRTDALNFSDADRKCSNISESKFPVRNEVAQKTDYDSHVDKCTEEDECDGKNFKVTERPVTKSYVMDVNELSRNEYYKKCMASKGWIKKLF